MLGLRQPETPQLESNGGAQSDNTVLSLIFSSSYLRRDAKMLKTCRFVSKSWNVYATESLAACSTVRLKEGESDVASFRTLLLNRNLGSFQNFPTPFQNYSAVATSFADRDFVDFFLNNPITSLHIRLTNYYENNPPLDFERLNLVVEANQANIKYLNIFTFNNGDVEWDEGGEVLISDEIQLTSLKTLEVSESCDDSVGACTHGPFMKKILSMCKPESLDFEYNDGDDFAKLLSQNNTENLRHFCLDSRSLSSDSWANLEKLRFPRLTSFSISLYSGPSDDDLPKWQSICQNVSPLLEKFKTTCPITSDGPIFPNLKIIEFEDHNSSSTLTPERFPSLVEVIYTTESELNVLHEDATSPNLGVQSLKLVIYEYEGRPSHYELLVLMTHMTRQFPKVSSLSFELIDFGSSASALAIIFETFPNLKKLCLNGPCSFYCFSGLDKATIISHVENGWSFERIPRRKSIIDFLELESITFGLDFDIDPDMIFYCLPRVRKLREISFYWNETLTVPVLRDSLGHLERIVILIFARDKNKFQDEIAQVGEMLLNTCVCYI